MDDDKLARILSEDHAPDIDINAQKRAVNLAVSAFKQQEQEKSKKTSQGISFISRLIDIGQTKKGVETMENTKNRNFMYGGMATAMAVVLVGGLSLTQLDETVRRNVPDRTIAVEVAITSQDDVIQTDANIDATKEQVARTLSEIQKQAGEAEDGVAPLKVEPADPMRQWRRDQAQAKDDKVSPAYVEAVENQIEEDLDRAITEGSSSIPVPVGSVESKNEVGQKPAPAESTAVPTPYKTQSIHKKGKIAGSGGTSMMADEGRSRVMSESFSTNMPTIAPDHDYYEPNPPMYHDQGRDKFEEVVTSSFKSVASEPVSTFSSDVDTASYSFVRRQLNNGIMPNPNAVRIEEMINYFDYNYPVPETRAQPFAPSVTVIDSPWASGKKLMHIGVKGYELAKTELRSNIVFLLDVSGSMNSPDKLPLVKNSMKMLLDSLHPDDTVSIVVYAGHTGVVLEPTQVSKRSTILSAMRSLRAGGGTAGAAGIELAYNMAEQNFDEGAVNRVILATDGDFNVGISSHTELKKYVERKRDKGIFLSVLGFGQGNYNDQMMQALAQNGNGVAAYIDNLNEARKVLVEEATSSLFPIAKDVKFQVEFNPAQVSEYRLIGYETRRLNREDFNNDKIDAGDIGAGHTVTAIYEFVPVGSEAVSVDPLRYTTKKTVKPAEDIQDNGELAFVKIRYKLPTENTSKLITRPVTLHDDVGYCEPNALCERRSVPADTAFATAVAAFGQMLRGGQHVVDYTYDDIIKLAQTGRKTDPFGYRAEFINLVRLAQSHSR